MLVLCNSCTDLYLLISVEWLMDENTRNAIFSIYNSTGYKYNRLEFYYLCFKDF